MDALKEGWFSELSTLWPGECFSLEVEEVLFKAKSKYQDVLVFKSKSYGNVLVLDGVIQATERDECAYQEMLSFLPLNSHPNPQKVLIIGGGDGGVAREVAKHPSVQSITQCEIDQMVIDVSKKYLPQMAKGFDSPKHTLHVGDGFEFMKKHQKEFDVIITDSSDPIGPASSLFEKEYFSLMRSALREGGVLASQGETIWLHLPLIADMQKFCRSLFPSVGYGYCTIPTYPSGQIGFTLCSLNPDTRFNEPCHVFSDSQLAEMQLKYYSPEIHRASFVLPVFAKKALSSEEDEKSNGN